MSLPCTNLTSIDLAERSGDNGVPVPEPLFDKLIKKALAHMFESNDIFCHSILDYLSKSAMLERLFKSIHPVGKKNRAPYHKDKILCSWFCNMCASLATSRVANIVTSGKGKI